VFDAQAFRFALDKRDLSLHAIVRLLYSDHGILVHRSTVHRWSKFRLYVTGSTPPLAHLRALEQILETPLLKPGPKK